MKPTLVFLRFNCLCSSPQLTSAPSESPRIAAEVLTLERRVFMLETMFRVSMAIPCVDLIVAVLFYSRAPKPLPATVAYKYRKSDSVLWRQSCCRQHQER